MRRQMLRDLRLRARVQSLLGSGRTRKPPYCDRVKRMLAAAPQCRMHKSEKFEVGHGGRTRPTCVGLISNEQTEVESTESLGPPGRVGDEIFCGRSRT
jgi:hypothetical protein